MQETFTEAENRYKQALLAGRWWSASKPRHPPEGFVLKGFYTFRSFSVTIVTMLLPEEFDKHAIRSFTGISVVSQTECRQGSECLLFDVIVCSSLVGFMVN